MYGTYIKASFSPPSQKEQWQNEARIKFIVPTLILEMPITYGHEFCYGTMNRYIIVLTETLLMIQRSWHLDLIIPKMVLHERLGFPCSPDS